MVGEYSNTGEAALVSAIIEREKTNAETEEDESVVSIEPEAHYDHYGNRGAADLYIETKTDFIDEVGYSGSVYEIKSEHAVEQANGAGDIIRQFKRMRKYFFKDESWSKRGLINYELCFIPTPKTLQHVEKNKYLYKEIRNFDASDSSNVVFRSPKKPFPPGIAFSGTGFDSVGKNLAHSRVDIARAAGVDLETIHEVVRHAREMSRLDGNL